MIQDFGQQGAILQGAILQGASPQVLTHLFVYGTLKPGFMYYRQYCAGRVVAQRPAIAYGELYALPMGYPAMTSGRATAEAYSEESIVHGYVLSFENDAILLELDHLEGYDPQAASADNDYNREWITVYTPDRQSLGMVWAYLMVPETIQHHGGTRLLAGVWTGAE